jgi:hypothetical protein
LQKSKHDFTRHSGPAGSLELAREWEATEVWLSDGGKNPIEEEQSAELAPGFVASRGEFWERMQEGFAAQERCEEESRRLGISADLCLAYARNAGP